MRSNYQTLEKLIKRVISRLSMYQGTSVQVYAEDRIGQMILDQYELVVDSFDWQLISHWNKYTITGNDGVVAEDVSKDIVDFTDIVAIMNDEDDGTALKRIHTTSIPSRITGTTAIYYQQHPTNTDKVFQVLPLESTGIIWVNAKGKLNTNTLIKPSVIIPFDSDYLVYAVCVDYLADDDSSQTQLQKFISLRDQRLSILKAKDNAGTIDLNDAQCYFTSTEWR